MDGRERYLAATRTALAIEKLYRKNRKKTRLLSAQDRSETLSEVHRDSAELICNLCLKNGAIWVKFAQFLSCRADLLPYEYIVALQRLQNDAIPATFEQIHPIILQSWTSDWDRLFTSFDAVPVATASVAQVHKATLKNGQDVAVKFQLPQARALFEQDSRVFASLARSVSPLINEIDLNQVTGQLITMTLEELDFNREAANLTRFKSQQHLTGIIVPELVKELSNERVLVTSWIDGIKLSDYLVSHPKSGKALLQRLLASYIHQITQLGIYHADPHPGNFLVTQDEQIAILDYGAIATLSRKQRARYTALLVGLMGMSTGASSPGLGELFRQAGFDCEQPETLLKISDHIMGDNNEQLTVSERLSDSLYRLRQNRVSIPDSFVSMARVIITIGGFMNQYDVDFVFDPGLLAA